MAVDEQDVDGGLPLICDDAGDCFFRMYWDRVERDGSIAESDFVQSRPKPKHTRRTRMASEETQVQAPVAAAVEVVGHPVPGETTAPVAQIAIPSPATAAHEIAGLVQPSGAGGVTVALAAIAVLGGGAGWKFYSQWAKQRHEERMAEIERGSSNDDENRKRCDGHAATSQAAISGVSAKVDALATRVDALETNKQENTASLSIGDDVAERIAKVEKALKALRKPTTTKR